MCEIVIEHIKFALKLAALACVHFQIVFGAWERNTWSLHWEMTCCYGSFHSILQHLTRCYESWYFTAEQVVDLTTAFVFRHSNICSINNWRMRLFVHISIDYVEIVSFSMIDTQQIVVTSNYSYIIVHWINKSITFILQMWCTFC